MNREETWEKNYKKIWKFVSVNHRGPSHHRDNEMKMTNWMKYNRKRLNKDMMCEKRKKEFIKLKELISSFHRINQYC